jgi:hypothetical protein
MRNEKMTIDDWKKPALRWLSGVEARWLRWLSLSKPACRSHPLEAFFFETKTPGIIDISISPGV